jgi:uncharacterized Ntn-hydrolase superfamily protein
VSKLNEDAALNVFATFSMVARCPKTFSLGVCTSSAASAVRSRVPHVEAEVGAIATQAHTNEKTQLLQMGGMTHAHAHMLTNIWVGGVKF